MIMMSHSEPDMSISPKITTGTTAVLGIVSKSIGPQRAKFKTQS
jgi:hypothetical protein